VNIIPALFYPLSLGALFFIIAFFKWPKYAIAALIVLKPVLDLTWDYTLISDINFLKIYAGLFAILGIVYICYHRPAALRHPVSIIWLIFIGLNLISVFVIAQEHYLFSDLKYLLSILTGFVAFVLFAELFDYRAEKKLVLSIFIGAGIVPALLWLIPVIISAPIVSNDPMKRIMGPYFNHWNFMFYSAQLIICGLIYHAVISCKRSVQEGNTVKRRWLLFKDPVQLLVIALVIIGVLMTYTCYSKIAWLSISVVLLFWFLFRKKLIHSLAVILLLVLFFISPLKKDLKKVFKNEIEYYTGQVQTDKKVFRGRLSRWKKGMKTFADLSLFEKLFGSQKTIGNPENQYLITLWKVGIIGLLVFIGLIIFTAYSLLHRFVIYQDLFSLGVFLILILFLIHAIGSYPMNYPAFQWFLWGSAGFALQFRNSDKR